MIATKITITGLDRVLNNMNIAAIAGPLRDFHAGADITIQNRARENAPVDTGQLRNSIGFAISAAPIPLWSKVGSSLPLASKAGWMEYGTGRLTDYLGGGKGKHWPP